MQYGQPIPTVSNTSLVESPSSAAAKPNQSRLREKRHKGAVDKAVQVGEGTENQQAAIASLDEALSNEREERRKAQEDSRSLQSHLESLQSELETLKDHNRRLENLAETQSTQLNDLAKLNADNYADHIQQCLEVANAISGLAKIDMDSEISLGIKEMEKCLERQRASRSEDAGIETLSLLRNDVHRCSLARTSEVKDRLEEANRLFGTLTVKNHELLEKVSEMGSRAELRDRELREAREHIRTLESTLQEKEVCLQNREATIFLLDTKLKTLTRKNEESQVEHTNDVSQLKAELASALNGKNIFELELRSAHHQAEELRRVHEEEFRKAMADKNEEIARLQTIVDLTSERDNEIKSIQAANKQEVDELRELLATALRNHATLEKQLRSELQSAEDENVELKRKIAAEGVSAGRLKENIKEKEIEIRERDTEIQALRSEIATTRASFDAAKGDMEAMVKALQYDVAIKQANFDEALRGRDAQITALQADAANTQTWLQSEVQQLQKSLSAAEIAEQRARNMLGATYAEGQTLQLQIFAKDVELAETSQDVLTENYQGLKNIVSRVESLKLLLNAAKDGNAVKDADMDGDAKTLEQNLVGARAKMVELEPLWCRVEGLRGGELNVWRKSISEAEDAFKAVESDLRQLEASFISLLQLQVGDLDDELGWHKEELAKRWEEIKELKKELKWYKQGVFPALKSLAVLESQSRPEGDGAARLQVMAAAVGEDLPRASTVMGPPPRLPPKRRGGGARNRSRP